MIFLVSGLPLIWFCLDLALGRNWKIMGTENLFVVQRFSEHWVGVKEGAGKLLYKANLMLEHMGMGWLYISSWCLLPIVPSWKRWNISAWNGWRSRCQHGLASLQLGT